MINQQLVDFIKSQLEGGLSKEIITKELLSNGWTAQDVEEGFNTINHPSSATYSTLNIPSQIKNHSKRNMLLITFFVIIGIGVFLFGVKIYNLRNNVKITAQNQVLNPYLNNEYNFSFSYPEDALFVKEEAGANLLKLTLYYTVQHKDFNILKTKLPFGAMVIGKQSYEQFIEKFKESETLNNVSEETTEKGGIVWRTALITDKEGFLAIKKIMTQKDGLNYGLLLMYSPIMLDNERISMENLGKMFIDTFKFTDLQQ